MCMKNSNLCLLLFLFIAIFISSCNDDSIGQFDSIVVESADNQYKFSQVSFVVSLEESNYGYLSIDQIDSIEIYVNAKYWGTFASETIDSDYWTNQTVNQLKFSDQKIKYTVVAPYQLKTDNLSTVGDFVEYLNDRVVLAPGEYIFEIQRIKFQNNQNEWIEVSSQAYKSFTVELNNASLFLDEFAIPFNL